MFINRLWIVLFLGCLLPALALAQGDWWQQSQETAQNLWERSRAATSRVLSDARSTLAANQPDHFSQLWRDTIPKLDQSLELHEMRRDLPQRAWFQRDQRDVERTIQSLLDDTVAALMVSPVQQHRDQIAQLEQAIERSRNEITEYRRERVSAPSQSMVKRTVADYDRLIEDRRRQIREHEQQLALIKRQFAGELRQMGLELSDEQVEFLLATVVGDNMIDLGIVFDNVKAITAQLEQLVEDSGEDLASARRYYGLYVILLRALKQMHLDVEQTIDTVYIPQINAIADHAHSLKQQTQQLKKSQPHQTQVLATNLQAQQLTIEAATTYRNYLEQQAQQVRLARQSLQQDLEVAWNTYETVRVSGELVALVKSSQNLLNGLLDRQIPTLRPFQNLEMQREFAKLTDQLRASSRG